MLESETKHMNNVFTIDTEDWYHANFEEGLFENNSDVISTVERNVERYLELFDKYSVKATFFVLGFVAEEHPHMIRKIADSGHEIASHGYAHQLVYHQTPEEFKEDVRKSKILVEDITGIECIGYRAPSWSVVENSLWALDILEDLGFKYHSAIFPTKNFLYGIPYAPRYVHGADVYGKKNLNILSVPPGTYKVMGVNIPFSGGAYFRLLPTEVIKIFTDRINVKQGQPVVFYLHPREIDPDQPRLKLKWKDHFIHYYGIRGCERKLECVLKRYKFVTMKEMLHL